DARPALGTRMEEFSEARRHAHNSCGRPAIPMVVQGTSSITSCPLNAAVPTPLATWSGRRSPWRRPRTRRKRTAGGSHCSTNYEIGPAVPPASRNSQIQQANVLHWSVGFVQAVPTLGVQLWLPPPTHFWSGHPPANADGTRGLESADE